IDLPVDGIGLEELFVGAEAVDLAVPEDDDPVGILHGAHPLGNDNLGGVGDLLQKRLADHGVGVGIHGGGGIVENQNLGLFEERPGDAKPLALAAGDVGAALLDVGIISVGEFADEA